LNNYTSYILEYEVLRVVELKFKVQSIMEWIPELNAFRLGFRNQDRALRQRRLRVTDQEGVVSTWKNEILLTKCTHET
jgi:hypothetical protein